MTWNPYLAKQVLQLGNSGEELENPILSGLPIQIKIRFNSNGYTLTGKAGITSPPPDNFYFIQDETDLLLYRANLITGEVPFQTSNEGVKNFIRVTSNSIVVWEKKLYIANLPDHAVQVYARESGWVSVNINTLSAIPLCCQMCPVRFFSEWYDQFNLSGFGGAKYVSIFDAGTEEYDETIEGVNRVTDSKIEEIHYIYLVKHTLKSIETHDITVRFKTGTGIQEDYVDANIRVQSPECWGFQIKDPIYY
jgi:hypothetical protein